MDKLFTLLERLCRCDGPSGSEDAVREIILNEIAGHCEAQVDRMGNIIAFKKGKKPAKHKVMLDAHMDEVGVIVTGATEAGLLRFEAVGGIETEALACKRVRFGDIVGVIGMKPIHLSTAKERETLPARDALFIDIGAKDREDALELVPPGTIGTFVSDFEKLSADTFRAKAVDDRVGCAALITLLQKESEYDFYATFTVGEELGCRGAKTAAFAVAPEFAIVLEATTAADLHGTPEERSVCQVMKGAVVSFMDRATQYDRALFELALQTAKEEKIPVQTKRAVAGGNNAGAISLSKTGVRTVAVSLPCRYIHSSHSVAAFRDVQAVADLAGALCKRLAAGESFA